MANSIDFSTFGDQTSYVDIGNIRIAFGTYTQSYNSGGEYQSSAISYGVTFSSNPKVIASPQVWAPITEFMVTTVGTTSFKVVIKHVYGSPTSIPVSWIAIGIKP